MLLILILSGHICCHLHHHQILHHLVSVIRKVPVMWMSKPIKREQMRRVKKWRKVNKQTANPQGAHRSSFSAKSSPGSIPISISQRASWALPKPVGDDLKSTALQSNDDVNPLFPRHPYHRHLIIMDHLLFLLGKKAPRFSLNSTHLYRHPVNTDNFNGPVSVCIYGAWLYSFWTTIKY